MAKYALSAALRDVKNNNISKSAIIDKFLLGYINAPYSTTVEAPSILILGRKLRCRLDLLYRSHEEIVHYKQSKAVQKYNNTGNRVYEIEDNVIIKFYQ